jgi:antitoxin MazE
MRAAVRKLGNSSGIIIPKPLLRELGVGAGDVMEIALDEGRLVLTPEKRRPRAGWADACRAIAEAGDDQLVWPEFGNADDENLTW